MTMDKLKINAEDITLPPGHSLVGVVTQTKDGKVFMSETVARSIKAHYGAPRHWTDSANRVSITILYLLVSAILCVFLFVFVRGIVS